MPESRSNRGKKKHGARQQPTPPIHDEISDVLNVSRNDDPMEKDETELELEKLVFGDDEGFRDGLRFYRQQAGEPRSESEESGKEDEIASKSNEAEEQDLDVLEDADLFFIDSGSTTNYSQAIVPVTSSDNDDGGADRPNYAAWIDSDDERITVSLATNPRLRKLRVSESEDLVNGKEYTKRLRQQFERLYPVPDWANSSASHGPSSRKRRKLSNADSSSEDIDSNEMSLDLYAQPLARLLQSTNSLTQTSPTSTATRQKLRPEVIDIQRTKDVSGIQPSAVTSISFHPTQPLLLSSGPSSTITLTHISPTSSHPNPPLTTLHIPNTPLATSVFSPSGTSIFFSGRRRYFHIWDLPTGQIKKISRIYGHASEQRTMERFKLSPDGKLMGLVGSGRKGGGVVNILDAATCQWVCQARVEGKGGVADFDWWGDGDGFVVLGKGGEAVEYSMLEKRVVARWMDEGAVGTTVVAVGGPKCKGGLGGDRYVVVGSQSGIVNIYDRSGWRMGNVPERPKPARVLEQLVTPTSHLCFSGDGQMLVMASRWKRDALRIVHLPSCTVYKNWPTASTPLGRITAVAISSNSELLAVANEQGKIRLWEIRA